MFKKLKRKITLVATLSMMGLMLALTTIITIINYSSVVAESDRTLEVLSSSGFSRFIKPSNGRPSNGFFNRDLSPEVPYESRYFSIRILSDGEITESNFSRIITVDSSSVSEYIKKACLSSKNRGFVGQFRYLRETEGDETKITFLDCGRRLKWFWMFLFTNVVVGFLGCLIVFVVFILVSGRFVKPIAESYEKQKRFISDAGHEMKTPLTVIKANLDLIEEDGIWNEELSDIRKQTDRLSGLTKDLVFLSSIDESSKPFKMIDFPLSDLFSEVVGDFKAVASVKHIDFVPSIQPDITFHGSPDSMKQLLTLVLDNAMKYSPENGEVKLDVSVLRKKLNISLINSTNYELSKNDMKKIFERFFRTDVSRNSETGGYGIGLSIVHAITEKHGGTVYATTTDGHDFKIEISIPV